MVSFRYNKRRRLEAVRVSSRRRRGSVLVFVMTILGVLFVTGMAFMMTMRFEEDMISAEQERDHTQPAIAGVAEEIGSLLVDSVDAISDQGDDGGLTDLPAVSFAELPGLFNLVAPLEPNVAPVPNSMDRPRVFPWFTNVEGIMLAADDSDRPSYRGLTVDTAWVSGVDPVNVKHPVSGIYVPFASVYPNLTPVDSDGDGVVDAMQVDLAEVGIKGRALDELAKVVNPPSKPDGPVYLGLRVVSHGGMVNLNDAHPNLIRGLDDPNATWVIPQRQVDPGEFVPYSPEIEEASLRRRGGLLPPYHLPPTRIQGNPLEPNATLGLGDYTSLVFQPGETLLDYRYWPFDPAEYDKTVDPNVVLWAIRMGPEFADANPNDDHYDRRHLVTTISHDDLFRRPTPGKKLDADKKLEREWDDALELMREVNANKGELVFEYADYPTGITNTYLKAQYSNKPNEPLVKFNLEDYWECVADDACQFNVRKGNLRLSLPWLDDNFDINHPVEKLTVIKYVQDVFTLMLLNARGSEWGDLTDYDRNGDDTVDDLDLYYDKDGDGDWTAATATDPAEETYPQVWVPDFAKIAETAAALTANMIDFADSDDEPTEVQVRSADYTDLSNFGQPVTGSFVYGLERQPFITEVTAQVTDDGTGAADPGASFYAVELFNPYEDHGPGADIDLADYSLTVTGGTAPIELNGILGPGEFAVFRDSDMNTIGSPPLADGQMLGGSVTGVPGLAFAPAGTPSTIKLWRDVDGTAVVVDEFTLGATGQVGELEQNAVVRSEYRYLSVEEDWYATVPDTDSTPTGGGAHGLGSKNAPKPNDWQPVQVKFANTGSLETAFPTTGSLLLLMRVANSTTAAFNVGLADDQFRIDNGRMPVFDHTFDHSIDPRLDPTVSVSASLPDEARENKGRAGDVHHLPWGQLVFDYFTAIPLDNDGPYSDPDHNNTHAPRVDEDGARVHGRIDLNTAPWSVLKGLPYVPMSSIPVPFQADFWDCYYPASTGNKDEAASIGEELAKGIVAYRDQRSVQASSLPYNDLTGDYGYYGNPTTDYCRGWTYDTPQVRRGMGYLTVGELANVRHPLVDTDGYRIDMNAVESRTDQTYNVPYLTVIAPLVSLGDWVTVRSQVFTVYGALRGEVDEAIEDDSLSAYELGVIRAKDVDTRALRFQETVDRLPTVLGESAPARVGDRKVTRYLDVRND